MSDFVPWLRQLAEDGGKGVVNNIDARCLGRIADELERLRSIAIERMDLFRQAATKVEELEAARSEVRSEEPVRWLITWPDGEVMSYREQPPHIQGTTVTPLYAHPAQSPDQFEITRLSGLLAEARKIIAEYKASTIAGARGGSDLLAASTISSTHHETTK